LRVAAGLSNSHLLVEGYGLARAGLSSVVRSSPPLRGVGIGCKGIIDTATSRVNSLPGDLNFLEGLLLADVIEAESLPVYADNDARTALVAEVLWGAARGKRNVALLTLGTGIGGAVLVDGAILRGASGAAGHLGHMTLDLNGGLCICGNRGCLEQLAGQARLLDSAQASTTADLVSGPFGGASRCATAAGTPTPITRWIEAAPMATRTPAANATMRGRTGMRCLTKELRKRDATVKGTVRSP